MKKVGGFFLALVPSIALLLIFFGSEFVAVIFMMIFSFAAKGWDGLYSIMDSIMNYAGELTFFMYICGGIPAVLFYYFGFYRKGMPLKENKRIRPSSFGLIALLGLGLYKAVDLLMIVISIVMPHAMENYVELIDSSSIGEFSFPSIVATVILAPVVEELVFRGLTLRLLRRSGFSFLVANIIQAVLFGCYHMNLVQGIYAFGVGLIFGFLANHYHTLLASMMLHAVFNFCGTIISQFESNLYDSFIIQMLLIAVGVGLTIAMMQLIRHQKPRKAVASPDGIPVLRQSPYEMLEDEAFI